MSILNISSASGLSRVVRGPGGTSLSLWAFFDLLRRVRRPAPGLCSLGCRNTPFWAATGATSIQQLQSPDHEAQAAQKLAWLRYANLTSTA